MKKKTIKKKLTLIKGLEALKLRAGTYVKAISHCQNITSDFLIRTDSDSRPFVCLETGVLWGNSIENYNFEKLSGIINIEIDD